MRRAGLVVVVVLAAHGSARAQKAEAEAAFERGRALMARGETAKACDEFQASMRFDPENGTLYNLALCHAALGKIATAWTELKELASSDTNAGRAHDAAKRAAALEPRLPRMRLVTRAPAPGEVVLRDDLDVTTFVGADTPVDPGHYTFVARAPGREPATVVADLTRGGTIDVEIPELHAPATPAQAPAPVVEYPTQLPLRPLVLPSEMVEVYDAFSVANYPAYKTSEIDNTTGARGAYGPVEGEAAIAFHLQSSVSPAPTEPSSIYLAARYAYRPMFAFAVDYLNVEPRGGGVNGSDFRALVARKLILGSSVAIDGRAGVEYQQRHTSCSNPDAFLVFADGRGQLAATSWLSFQVQVLLDARLGGSLYTDTILMSMSGIGLVAITPRLDAFVSGGFSVAPSGTQMYVIGAAWRTR
jgi:tetratricopeptide (TPR) repeat protein